MPDVSGSNTNSRSPSVNTVKSQRTNKSIAIAASKSSRLSATSQAHKKLLKQGVKTGQPHSILSPASILNQDVHRRLNIQFDDNGVRYDGVGKRAINARSNAELLKNGPNNSLTKTEAMKAKRKEAGVKTRVEQAQTAFDKEISEMYGWNDNQNDDDDDDPLGMTLGMTKSEKLGFAKQQKKLEKRLKHGEDLSDDDDDDDENVNKNNDAFDNDSDNSSDLLSDPDHPTGHHKLNYFEARTAEAVLKSKLYQKHNEETYANHVLSIDKAKQKPEFRNVVNDHHLSTSNYNDDGNSSLKSNFDTSNAQDTSDLSAHDYRLQREVEEDLGNLRVPLRFNDYPHDLEEPFRLLARSGTLPLVHTITHNHENKHLTGNQTEARYNAELEASLLSEGKRFKDSIPGAGKSSSTSNQNSSSGTVSFDSIVNDKQQSQSRDSSGSSELKNHSFSVPSGAGKGVNKSAALINNNGVKEGLRNPADNPHNRVIAARGDQIQNLHGNVVRSGTATASATVTGILSKTGNERDSSQTSVLHGADGNKDSYKSFYEELNDMYYNHSSSAEIINELSVKSVAETRSKSCSQWLDKNLLEAAVGPAHLPLCQDIAHTIRKRAENAIKSSFDAVELVLVMPANKNSDKAKHTHLDSQVKVTGLVGAPEELEHWAGTIRDHVPGLVVEEKYVFPAVDAEADKGNSGLKTEEDWSGGGKGGGGIDVVRSFGESNNSDQSDGPGDTDDSYFQKMFEQVGTPFPIGFATGRMNRARQLQNNEQNQIELEYDILKNGKLSNFDPFLKMSAKTQTLQESDEDARNTTAKIVTQQGMSTTVTEPNVIGSDNSNLHSHGFQKYISNANEETDGAKAENQNKVSLEEVGSQSESDSHQLNDTFIAPGSELAAVAVQDNTNAINSDSSHEDQDDHESDQKNILRNSEGMHHQADVTGSSSNNEGRRFKFRQNDSEQSGSNFFNSISSIFQKSDVNKTQTGPDSTNQQQNNNNEILSNVNNDVNSTGNIRTKVPKFAPIPNNPISVFHQYKDAINSLDKLIHDSQNTDNQAQIQSMKPYSFSIGQRRLERRRKGQTNHHFIKDIRDMVTSQGEFDPLFWDHLRKRGIEKQKEISEKKRVKREHMIREAQRIASGNVSADDYRKLLLMQTLINKTGNRINNERDVNTAVNEKFFSINSDNETVQSDTIRSNNCGVSGSGNSQRLTQQSQKEDNSSSTGKIAKNKTRGSSKTKFSWYDLDMNSLEKMLDDTIRQNGGRVTGLDLTLLGFPKVENNVLDALQRKVDLYDGHIKGNRDSSIRQAQSQVISYNRLNNGNINDGIQSPGAGNFDLNDNIDSPQNQEGQAAAAVSGSNSMLLRKKYKSARESPTRSVVTINNSEDSQYNTSIADENFSTKDQAPLDSNDLNSNAQGPYNLKSHSDREVPLFDFSPNLINQDQIKLTRIDSTMNDRTEFQASSSATLESSKNYQALSSSATLDSIKSANKVLDNNSSSMIMQQQSKFDSDVQHTVVIRDSSTNDNQTVTQQNESDLNLNQSESKSQSPISSTNQPVITSSGSFKRSGTTPISSHATIPNSSTVKSQTGIKSNSNYTVTQTQASQSTNSTNGTVSQSMTNILNLDKGDNTNLNSKNVSDDNIQNIQSSTVSDSDSRIQQQYPDSELQSKIQSDSQSQKPGSDITSYQAKIVSDTKATRVNQSSAMSSNQNNLNSGIQSSNGSISQSMTDLLKGASIPIPVPQPSSNSLNSQSQTQQIQFPTVPVPQSQLSVKSDQQSGLSIPPISGVSEAQIPMSGVSEAQGSFGRFEMGSVLQSNHTVENQNHNDNSNDIDVIKNFESTDHQSQPQSEIDNTIEQYSGSSNLNATTLTQSQAESATSTIKPTVPTPIKYYKEDQMNQNHDSDHYHLPIEIIAALAESNEFDGLQLGSTPTSSILKNEFNENDSHIDNVNDCTPSMSLTSHNDNSEDSNTNSVSMNPEVPQLSESNERKMERKKQKLELKDMLEKEIQENIDNHLRSLQRLSESQSSDQDVQGELPLDNSEGIKKMTSLIFNKLLQGEKIPGLLGNLNGESEINMENSNENLNDSDLNLNLTRNSNTDNVSEEKPTIPESPKNLLIEELD